MRLTLSALLCAALFAGPALARDHQRGPMMPPPGQDMPPPPYYGGPHHDGPYRDGYADPRWERMHAEWMERCRNNHRGHEGRDYPDSPGYREGCGQPVPYGYGHPGAYMGYAVPMIMVPVLRSKPCKEVVEEIVEEVVPVRRRVVPRPRLVPDKRVPLREKRVPITPTKRIAY